MEAVCRAESRRVFATLIPLLGDLDLAEEGLRDACRAACGLRVRLNGPR